MAHGSQDRFPLARSEDLVTETVGAETVVYDGLSQESHCLAPLAAIVFGASDGRTSPADLAGIASARLGESVDVAQVEQALAELEERDLIIAPADGDGLSRRQLVRRTAVVGGAVWATPLILSSQAFAASFGQCTNCPTGRLFSLRHEAPCTCTDTNPDNACLPASPAGIANGCCLIPSRVQVSCQSQGSELTSVTYTLGPGVQFCAGGGKGGPSCDDPGTVTVTPNQNGTTTVVISKSGLSHTDIVVCVAGSPPLPAGCTGT
jgi:hypothetical protein